MVALLPDITSSGDCGNSSLSSISTNLLPQPVEKSVIPISPDEHKPPEFFPIEEDEIQARTFSDGVPVSPSVRKTDFKEAPASEAFGAVTVKEENNDDSEEVVIGFTAGDCDGFSGKMSSSFSSVHLPKPMEGLHEIGPPPFLKKTFEMVEDPETNSTVSWSQNGDSFTVWDEYEFSKHLLPKYFKHSNFSSFIRQLNTYGFRKIDPDRWEFANEGFRGGKKHLLKNINRRSRSNKQQQNGYGVDSAKLDLETQIESLKNDQDQLRVEINKLRHQQEESENQLCSVEQRIQSAHCKQLQMFMFLVKAARSRTFLQNLLAKTKQRKELNGPELCKKRKLLHTQFPESLADGKVGSQCVNCRNQAQQRLATMQTQLTEILGEDTEQGKTMPKLFETPLCNDFCTPILDHKANTMTDTYDQESVYHLMSEELLDDSVVPQNSVDAGLDVNDSKFYLELEDLIGKPKTWGGLATGLAGCI